MTTARPTWLTDLDPLPEVPVEAAKAALSAMLLAFGESTRIDRDPYGVAKMINFDRLIFCKMPVLCDGPGRVLTLGPTRRAECGAKPCCGRSKHEGGKGCIFT